MPSPQRAFRDSEDTPSFISNPAKRAVMSGGQDSAGESRAAPAPGRPQEGLLAEWPSSQGPSRKDVAVSPTQGGPVVKKLPANTGDVHLIPELGRSSGVENGKPLQYSCLENSMDRGAWRALVHGVTKSQTRLND